MEKESGLDRWFKEKWVDISKKDKSGKHPPCGRKDADKGKYPKCRPSKRVSKKTPKTSKEMSKAEKEKANKAKRKVEKKKSKPAGGGARKPKRAPTIKKKKKSNNMSILNRLKKMSALLEDASLKGDVKTINKILNKIAKNECPTATQDIEVNTKNRNSTRDKHNYGPLNPARMSMAYWGDLANKWNASVDEAMSSRCSNCVAFDVSPRMKDCMPLVDEGLGEKFGNDLPGFDLDEYDLEFGYCWMHHFKCLSARTCDTWAGGGPIKDDDDSYEWQEKNSK